MCARMTTQTHSMVALLSWLLIVFARKIVPVELRRLCWGAVRGFFAGFDDKFCGMVKNKQGKRLSKER